MRTLIIQAIVHTPADMGSMKDVLRQKGIEKLGKKAWEENQKKIEKFWDEVEEAIDKLDLDYGKVRIYQDGMPVDGELALKIVNETAEKGSKNYQIIKKMIEKGATIEMTEDPKILLEEYNYVKKLQESYKKRKEAMKEYENKKDSLLKKRDKFIAERVDKTLKESETGFLFIGAHHNVKPLIQKDIQIKNLG
ncbi:MAG: hypothetical protein KKG75_01295 [Nanoarchaeota archaeon]|nr:hypothetical protein [Nanoarchaeota archaeon]